ELVAELEQFFSERSYLPERAALILALYTINTYTFECFDTVAFLLVESPVPQCGKTTVVERLVGSICARPQVSASLTEAALFRIIDQLRPTLIIDEAEKLERPSERSALIRAIAHAGYKKGGQVARCEGDQHEVRFFNVYGPQVYAAVGGLSGALLDRCIVIH